MDSSSTSSSKENESGLKRRLAELAAFYEQEQDDANFGLPSTNKTNATPLRLGAATSNTPRSPPKSSASVKYSIKTPQANPVVPKVVPVSTSRTPGFIPKTPANTPYGSMANNQPLPDESAAAAMANRPVSKVAALWEQRCREEAALVNSARASSKRRSRSGSPSMGQVAKRTVARGYSPVSSVEDSASSVTTGDYLTAASTSDASEIPPPVPPPLHAAPTVILHAQQNTQQTRSVHVQEMRLDFESKLAALGFEMIDQTDTKIPRYQDTATGGIAAVNVNSPLRSPVQTVRAEPAVGVSRTGLLPNGTGSAKLPPSGASRSGIRLTPGGRPHSAQNQQSSNDSDDEESSHEDVEEEEEEEEDFEQLVSRARQQVEEIVRREIEEEVDSEEYDDDIVPLAPPPPPPRGRSLGLNADAYSNGSTSAWTSTEDIHAAAERLHDNAGSRQDNGDFDDEDRNDVGDAIDELSFASSENEEAPAAPTNDATASVAARKSSTNDPRKESWVEERERDLKRQLIVQDGVIQQTMKALLECQSRRQEHLASAKKKKLGIHLFGATKVEPTNKQHISSTCTVGSLAEAEFYRVLLIANERRKAILSELRRLGSRRATIAGKADTPPVTVTISDITLQLKHEFRMRQISSADYTELYYFVVLLRHGPTVLHTVCIGTDEARDGVITFPNMLQLSDVRAVGTSEADGPGELNVKISIYGLTLPRDVPASLDVVSKHKKTGSHHHHTTSPTHATIPPGSGITTPFYCVDSASITREIIRQATTSPRGVASVPLNCMPSKWPLMPSVKLRARCALSAPIEHAGFLTFFTNASPGSLPAWHRRWAHLRTTEIFFYSEPDAEPSNPSGPLPCFDLHNVAQSCSTAEQVSPFVCARPWTLELVLDNNSPSASSASSVASSYDNEQHQPRLWFAADTRSDFYEWRDAINRALSAIKLWGLVGSSQQIVGSSSATSLGKDVDITRL